MNTDQTAGASSPAWLSAGVWPCGAKAACRGEEQKPSAARGNKEGLTLTPVDHRQETQPAPPGLWLGPLLWYGRCGFARRRCRHSLQPCSGFSILLGLKPAPSCCFNFVLHLVALTPPSHQRWWHPSSPGANPREGGMSQPKYPAGAGSKSGPSHPPDASSVQHHIPVPCITSAARPSLWQLVPW